MIRRFRLLEIRHIRLERGGLSARLPDLLYHFIRPLRAICCSSPPQPRRAREFQRHGAPNAARAAGHHRHFIFQR
ncbi:MAG: hypothetical protein MZV63_06810 [Marinilabiliales bacterium]|nr:hypothetical protein [Marinilabiliales bacterium]